MHRRMAIAVWLLPCAIAVVTPAQRLAETAVPEHYDIHLAPDFDTDTFAGRAGISLRLTEPTRAITLNAAELVFHEATVTAAGTTQAASVAMDQSQETATLAVAQTLPAGPATVTIRYGGALNSKLRGFYLSRTSRRKYAVTQLEPTDARRAFPSFDEPAMKATFALSVTIDAGDTAISNGPVVADTPGPGAGTHTVRFATTRRMAPYLVAMLIGDWACLTGRSDGIPLRVCGTPERKDELAFALEAATVSLRYFNRYFSIRYPFDKLDIIAVPDFAAGAMENTGAIVFREQLLASGADGSSLAQRKLILQYVAHEIAHQWFGDLVTLRWWDDSWLNEGFATWMERRPMAEWKPEWHAALDEVRDTQNAMNLDALRSTRPIRTHVETPTEISQVFDALAYQKTAAVIRMAEGYVGAARYREGINAYLKKFAYGNAAGEDLWTTLASVTGAPVDRIFSSYITQAGMPLVTVEASCTRGRTQLSLAQKPISSAMPPATTWTVPVCYRRERNGKAGAAACAVLSERSTSVTLDGCSSWIFANVDGRGYYRTSYGSDGLRALGEAVRDNALTPAEQTSLLEDVWALVLLNEESIADYLALAGRVIEGPTAPAIPTTLGRINYIADKLVDESGQAAFAQWVRRTLRPAAERLGWAPRRNESEDVQGIRSRVLFTLGYAGADPEVREEARRLVDGHTSAGARLDRGILGTALQLAAINGDEGLYDAYVAELQRAPEGSDAGAYRGALPYFSNPVLIARTLAYATSSEVRTQDAPGIIGNLMARPWAAAPAWEHVKDHWSTLTDSLDVFQGLPAVVGATQNFCDSASRNDVRQFFDAHLVRGTERSLQQSLETIDRCMATRTAQSERLATFLRTAAAGD